MKNRTAYKKRHEMVTIRAVYGKALSLCSLSTVEFGTPLIRMLILSRFLNLHELGFASALAATYSTFEQITDIAIYRFVFSSPRADYEEALASAHALSLLRGCIVAALAFVAAPGIAYMLSLSADWTSFAWLSIIILARSFEHLAPKVAERDYRYGAQFKVSFVANGVALVALVATAVHSHNHNAVLASLSAQVIGTVVASHILAEQPYRLKVCSPYFKGAWKYGYPLMFNGLGLALSGQGDRLMVGSLLGLPVLGIYSVVLLVSVVPTSMIFKIMGTISLAALRNASATTGQFEARLRLYGRFVPLIAACYALALLALFNIAVPLAFGSQFAVSNWVSILLSGGAFFKIVRTEPFTSLLLHEMKTGTLALANQSAVIGLLIGTILAFAYRSLEAALVGRLIGEMIGLCVTIYLTSVSFRSALSDYLMSMTASFAIVLLECGTMLTTLISQRPMSNLVLVGVCVVSILVWASVILPALFHESYSSHHETPPAKSF